MKAYSKAFLILHAICNFIRVRQNLNILKELCWKYPVREGGVP